jgi:hypothetical protein
MFLVIGWLREKMSIKKPSANDEIDIVVQEEKEDHYLLNGLILLRIFLHSIILYCSDNGTLLKVHLYTVPPNFEKWFPNMTALERYNPVRTLLNTCLSYLCENNPKTTGDFMIHLELLHILMTLFSTTLYGRIVSLQSNDRSHNIFLETALQFSDNESDHLLAMRFTRKMIDNYMKYCMELRNKELSPSGSSLTKSFNLNFLTLFASLENVVGAILYRPLTAILSLFRNNDNLENNNHNMNTNELKDNFEKTNYSSKYKENFVEMIGKRSILVILFLCFYNKSYFIEKQQQEELKGKLETSIKTERRSSSTQKISNPYLDAISNIKNSDDASIINIEDSYEIEKKISYSFDRIFHSIVHNFEERENAVLCYLLLYSSKHFLEYVLSRPDTDTIMLPILHKLYSCSVLQGASNNTNNNSTGSEKENKFINDSDHTYILCTILLILSQDPTFNSNNQRQRLEKVPWYKDSVLQKIDFGSLCSIILYRLMLVNIRTRKDLYLNNNCLAILNNMSVSFEDMHTKCAQHSLGFTKALAQKSLRIIRKLKEKQQKNNKKEVNNTLEDNKTRKLMEELELYIKFLQLSLESINTIFTNCMKRNSALIYELLQQRSLVQLLTQLVEQLDSFQQLELVRDFQPFIVVLTTLVSNMNTVLEFFENKLKEYERLEKLEKNEKQGLITELDYLQDTTKSKKNHQWTVQEIMNIIHIGVKAWLTKQQHLQSTVNTATNTRFIQLEHPVYHYTEDSGSEYFFLIYLWRLIVDQVDQIVWDLDKSVILFAVTDTEDNIKETKTNESVVDSNNHENISIEIV